MAAAYQSLLRFFVSWQRRSVFLIERAGVTAFNGNRQILPQRTDWVEGGLGKREALHNAFSDEATKSAICGNMRVHF